METREREVAYGSECVSVEDVTADVEGGREGEREGGKEGWREGEREGGREGGREGEREGGREKKACLDCRPHNYLHSVNVSTLTSRQLHTNYRIPCLDEVVAVLPVASTVTCVLGGELAVTQENTFHNNYSGRTKVHVCLSVVPCLPHSTTHSTHTHTSHMYTIHPHQWWEEEEVLW